MKIGEIIRNRREELGFTTYEVARHTSLDEKHYKQIESGTVVPGMNVLRCICSALEIKSYEDMERERREQYMKTQRRRREHVATTTSMVPLAKMTPQPMKHEQHKCVADSDLAKGHHRICVTVTPQVWSALQELKEDMTKFVGVEPTLRGMINTVVLSVYDFKKNQPEKFTYQIKDFGEKL